MAKSGHACLCLLVFLATFAQCGFAISTLAQIGSIHMFNDAGYDMLIKSEIQLQSGSKTDPGYSPLPQGTAFQFQVTDGMLGVRTWFRMTTPSGQYEQFVVDWTSVPGSMPIPCTPDCYWIVDANGFSVSSSEKGQLQFVIGWNKQ